MKQVKSVQIIVCCMYTEYCLLQNHSNGKSLSPVEFYIATEIVNKFNLAISLEYHQQGMTCISHSKQNQQLSV